ncbi:MAG: hypothetical protein DMG04_22480 [Acidobacteria bacterium]|nr:MAG: hypothetical protein DMG04_22480 [Acidobacteriota bacterium]
MQTVNGARPDPLLGRASIAQRIEQFGVVAVIRLKDPAKLRAVVDALADGGVRALEVTMTVPRAVEMIRALAPTLPDGPRGARGRRRHREGLPGHHARTAVHKGCARAVAAGEADADRRRHARQRGRLDSRGRRRGRHWIGVGRHEGDRGGSLRRDHDERT